MMILHRDPVCHDTSRYDSLAADSQSHPGVVHNGQQSQRRHHYRLQCVVSPDNDTSIDTYFRCHHMSSKCLDSVANVEHTTLSICELVQLNEQSPPSDVVFSYRIHEISIRVLLQQVCSSLYPFYQIVVNRRHYPHWFPI